MNEMLDIKEEIIKKEKERKKMVQDQIRILKKDIEEMMKIIQIKSSPK